MCLSLGFYTLLAKLSSVNSIITLSMSVSIALEAQVLTRDEPTQRAEIYYNE